MKFNQSRPGFELVSPCSFPTTITITPRAPPDKTKKTKKQREIIERLQTNVVVSCLVMRHGFLSTNQKPGARTLSGSLWCHWGRRKQDKVMLTSFFDVRGNIHSEFLLQGQMNKSASLQGDPPAYASLNAQEETRTLAGGFENKIFTI